MRVYITLKNETLEEVKLRMRKELQKEMEKFERDNKAGAVDVEHCCYVRAHSRY